MKQPPRSDRFDDVYFSAGDGLAETRHVFVEGNDLPARWQGRERFTVAETGFGTGLNFLAAWALFDATAAPGAFLDYISVEKYPLGAADIAAYLAPWAGDLEPYLGRYLARYPLRVPGFHRIVFGGRVALTLIFDDVHDALPQMDAAVDAWFLDGFTPAKNPDMWTPDLFAGMARLSAPGATFATFTAAGDVKRGLQAAGFDVRKQKGFGHKRDMLAGTYTGQGRRVPSARPRRVAIVGGGLAGCAAACVLPQYGIEPVLYEKNAALAQEASGNPAGLYNPRFTALRGPESDFFAAAYAQACGTFREQAARGAACGFDPCGALHLIHDADREKRLTRTAENWGWHGDHMRLLDPGEASAIAGVPLGHAALYLPDSGLIDPRALCEVYAKDAEIRFGRDVTDLETLEEDAVIMAPGAGAVSMAEAAGLPLHTVRGQLTFAAQTDGSRHLKSALCYGGYVAPARDGIHVCGATFQKWLDDTALREDDDAYNLGNLSAAVPALSGLSAQGGRAALRVSSKDRFPVVGRLRDALYISAAFGSHGLIGSLMAAHLLADMLRGGPFCLSAATRALLEPLRFAARAARH